MLHDQPQTGETRADGSHRAMAAAALVLCFVVAMAARGANESFTVYLLPISATFGWDRADVVSIYSLSSLTMGLAGPFVGQLFDRAGPRIVYIAGPLLLGTGLFASAFAQHLWQLQLSAGLVTGAGVACLSNVACSILLSRWYGKGLPAAMALIYSAAGAGIMLLVPLSQILIDRFEWRGAYQITGATLLLLAIPVALLPWRALAKGNPDITRPVKTDTGVSDWTLPSAMRHHLFWALFWIFFFTGVGMFAISVQIVAYLVDAGFPPLQAATAWGSAGIIMFVGLISITWLDRLIGRVPAILISYGLTSLGLGMLWLLHRYPTPLVLTGFLLCFGSTVGNRGPLLTATAMSIFRGSRAGTIFGAISLGQGLGLALGSWSGGLIHDLTGGYDWVIAFALINLWLGAAPFLIFRALR